jgi:hypothetical protein
MFEKIPDRLIQQYRTSWVKHADETSWRTNGKNGYVWLFATAQLSIFQFRILALAMGLRGQKISDVQFYRKSALVKLEILACVKAEAKHPGIQRIQNIFRDHSKRMYLWAQDRSIPADNNLAERDLRPTVIAGKVSFGSASDAGAHTRSILMTVLCSLKKQTADVETRFKYVLDQLAKNIQQDPFPLLFLKKDSTIQASPA